MAHGRRLDRRRIIKAAITATGAMSLARPALAQAPSDPSRGSMAAAEELSVLEATEHIPALYEFYARMHPDAQRIVPRHVVIGWYQDEWHPKGPHPARATGFRFVDWTWPVNGVTYPVSEVSFVQTFDNAPAVEDVVRLALVDDEWCWFFGRDRSWVAEQIAHYNDRAYISQAGEVPHGLERVVSMDRRVIESLPIRIGTAHGELVSDARQIPDYAAHMPMAVQYREGEFPVGYAMATTLKPEDPVRDTVERIVREHVEAPPFTLLAWNLNPANDVPFARYEHHASEAVGNARTITWGGVNDNILWQISFVDEARLEELARALVAMAATP